MMDPKLDRPSDDVRIQVDGRPTVAGGDATNLLISIWFCAVANGIAIGLRKPERASTDSEAWTEAMYLTRHLEADPVRVEQARDHVTLHLLRLIPGGAL
ncbi:hypothetical protein ACOACO_17635 [Nocardioides sp. CPCC 205120]|uniref:hypothetical protein n=1 Tax=Nocardioides sp. CPCC 205120 TaxID=3406462 RepID=UPI003B50EDA3